MMVELGQGHMKQSWQQDQEAKRAHILNEEHKEESSNHR